MAESKAQRIERLSTKALWMKLALVRRQRAAGMAASHALIAKLDADKAAFDKELAEKDYLVAEEEYLAARLEGEDIQ